MSPRHEIAQQVDKLTSLQGALARQETEYFRAVHKHDWTAAHRISWNKKRLWDEIDALQKQIAS